MLQKWLDVLFTCPLFEGIEASELSDMIGCLDPQVYQYKKNDLITAAGDKFTGIGVVLAGEAAVAKENAAGNRVIITMLKAGEIFGEMAAFAGDTVWPATVSAQTPCSVFFLPPGKILGECRKLCPSHRRLTTNMLGIVSKKALVLNRKVEYLVIGSLRGKIAAFLLEQHRKTGKFMFLMKMNRNELADFLNVSRPSLSREMCRLRDEGLIEFHRSSVQLKNVEVLKAMVE